MKPWTQAWKIRLRLFVAAALPAVMVVLLLVVAFLNKYESESITALQERARASAAQLAGAAEFPLFAGDTEALKRLVDAAMTGDGQLRAVAVVARQGGQVVVSGRLPDALPTLTGQEVVQITPQRLVMVLPILPTLLPPEDPFQAAAARSAQLQWSGHAVLVFSLEVLHQRKNDVLVGLVLSTLGALVAAAVLATWLAAGVTGPIDRISGVVERIGAGDLTARVEVKAAGVMASLAEGVNAMAGKVAYTQNELTEQVERVTRELREQKDAAEKAARTDLLTGLASRRAFTESADLEMQRALRYSTPLSLVMVDLDHFKRINDNFGHRVGDTVLVSFARIVSQQVREVDVVGRLGGEEFAILLPNTDVAEAVRVTERIRLAVANNKLESNGQVIQYTASFGIATFSGHEVSLGGFMDRADVALYKAKRYGRNRVELAPTPLL
jgi:diguanylate cyclase